MIIAYSPMMVLGYFRPHEQIIEFMKTIPQLVEVIGSSVVERYINCEESERQKYLKGCFSSLMTASPDVIERSLSDLLKNEDCSDVVKFIHTHFPGDVGCFVFYFLNYLQLNPGDAFFIDVNEPHCYLYGGK